MTRILPDGVDELVKERAAVVHRRYGRWVDREDLIQEGMLWCVTRVDYLSQAFDEPDADARK